MKLPNADRAFVDMAKLRDYALDPIHWKGKHKARVFASALGSSLELSPADFRERRRRDMFI